MEIQEGDKHPEAFSFEDKIDDSVEQLPCYLTYTNAKTHEIIRKIYIVHLCMVERLWEQDLDIAHP